MSNRVERVNSLLRDEISKIILRDFAFSPEILITLTRAEVSGNLIEAKIYISAYPEEKGDDVIKILNREIFDIQQKINKKLNMRPVPKIIFVKDKVVSRAGKIEELLGRLKKDEK